uniref:Dynein axonemal assembly factor 5 n=1 Tax=Oryzias sinensis TaxID=183150 RepID=A0A8C8DHG9_9TELE
MAATAGGEEHVSSEVLRGLAHHLNCLNEDNKATRKRAIEFIKKETVDKGLSSGVLQEIFSALLKPLLKCLSDPMERCRETAISVITEFIRCVPKPEEFLPYLMPCLAQRFGENEILEPAEELRLSAVDLLSLTVEVCGKHLAPYVSEMIKILQRTIVDPFPDVKRESCRCTVNFAQSVPEHFHMQADSLVKPLMMTITHQHSRVRVAVIEATGSVIQHGSGRNMDDVLPHLSQRFLDDSPQVRKAVTAVVGDWLLHLRDRYSYFHKLIPLLLSNTTDEIPEIRLLAADLWKRAGTQWEKENEEDIKDKMDFLLAPPAHYPPGVDRPVLGCRELVVRNLGRLIPAITHDLTDWLVPTRIRTSQLLCVLLLHAEDHSTQHLQPLLETLYRTCTETEKEVVKNCLAAAKLIGTFVPPPVFLKLLLDRVNTPHSSACSWAPLMVLAAVLQGCSKPLLKPHLQQIADTLVQPSVCQEYQQVVYLQQLLACVDVLLRQCESDCGAVSLQLLQVLISIQSLSAEPQLIAKVRKWLTSFSLFIGEFLNQLMPIVNSCLQPDRDKEMRMSIFTMLAKLLLDGSNTLDSQGCFRDEAESFLCNILLPNLVWKAGRTAGALRTSALSCLLALLHGGAITPGQLLCLEEKLSPHVLSSLEEDSQMGRLMACRSLSAMLKLIGRSMRQDTLNQIYPELLKRLDDSNAEVRAAALHGVGLWFSSLTKDYSSELCAPHLQLLFQQLLLHLDDPNPAVQDQVLEILKKASVVHPVLLKREAEAAKDKHRSPVYCQQLLQHISSLSAETTAPGSE